jgi:nicotinate-nucleotide adenylyltransferase
MRIGVFGGAFDPPHAAHAALAKAAAQQRGLDRVLWVPTFTPPHKDAPAAPFAHRLGMAAALAAGDAVSRVSGIEASLPPPSYTLRTLRALKAQEGPGHEWELILGADNWAGFPRWHDPAGVLAEATLAVYPRAGFPAETLPALPEGSAMLNFPEMPHRSVEFRNRLARDREGALASLPPVVAAYIRAHALYAETA